MINTINPKSVVPLYKQIANLLAQDIKDGKYTAGDKLPSELMLKDLFGVSRITIRAAIAELIDEGLLVRSQGKGTFIAQQKSMLSANDHPGLPSLPSRREKRVNTAAFHRLYYPSPGECQFLQLKETEKIIMTKRLRFIENYPTVIETNHYIPDFSFLFNEI